MPSSFERGNMLKHLHRLQAQDDDPGREPDCSGLISLSEKFGRIPHNQHLLRCSEIGDVLGTNMVMPALAPTLIRDRVIGL
jgi:hypothetical protein